MAKTVESGTHSNIAPFLMKCYEMVDDESTDNIISWSQSNDSFVIWNITDFSSLLLPKYFKHQNFSSFMRQLNIYGFKKVDTDLWKFANEAFVKGQKHLLSNIKRRKHPPQSGTQKNAQQENQTSVTNEVDYSSLQREVEILKIDKSTVTQELVKLRQHQESSEKKLLLLGERLEGMENNQQQLLSFLVMVIQNPRLLVQLLHPNKENNWRSSDSAKISLDKDAKCENSNAISDGMIVRYQHMPDDDVAQSGSGSVTEHEISIDNVKDFFKNLELPSCPIDESFLSNENSGGSIIVPELDLALLEKFLLSSPSRDDPRNAQLDEESIDVENEMELSPKYSLLWKEGLKDFPSLEILTEELAFGSPGEKQ